MICKSTYENCQILCFDCNLKKTNKELQDFVLDEKAQLFLSGVRLTDNNLSTNSVNVDDTPTEPVKSKTLTKDEFDDLIKSFIGRKGNIHKVDFSRTYNHLPSVHYVKVFYGNLNNLKKAFGIEDLSLNWSRARIKEALSEYVSIHGNVSEKDLKSANKLPSYPCILKYYPEYNSFSKFKEKELGLPVAHTTWTVEEVIEAGKQYVEQHKKLTEKDLNAKNGLPTTKVIYSFFGTLANYQQIIGAPVPKSNEYVSKEELALAVDNYFKSENKIVESADIFFNSFPYSKSTVCKRYGSLSAFFVANHITVLKSKKAAYTKKEVDNAIHNWIKSGNPIPKSKELTSFGLPSMSVILKYYEDWREPFIMYKRIFDEANRNTSM